MPRSEDAHDNRLDADDAGMHSLELPSAHDPRGESGTRRSAGQRLRVWLFNMIPIALSLASAYLMLYLLAKLTGLH